MALFFFTGEVECSISVKSLRRGVLRVQHHANFRFHGMLRHSNQRRSTQHARYQCPRSRPTGMSIAAEVVEGDVYVELAQKVVHVLRQVCRREDVNPSFESRDPKNTII